MRLIHTWTFGLKGQPKTHQQFAPVSGGGGEKKQGFTGKKGFDLRKVATYYTRPMSEGWSKLLDVDPLADGQADIDFAIPLAAFPRLSELLAVTAGEVRGRVRFAREIGIPVADVEVSGELPFTCQRCFGPMSVQVDSRERVAMVASEAEADRVPQGRETILAPDHRISIRDLVEEELLLTLPIVPLHAEDAEQCQTEGLRVAPEEATPASDTQRPFERLGELLKRDKSE
jgi:uncharacterized protein